jgi:MFS family permease
MISVVLVLHLVRTAGLTPLVVGAVLSVGEAGFLVGALSIGRIRRRLSMRAMLTAAGVVIAVSGFPIALAPLQLAVPLTALGLFVYGFAAVGWTVSASGYRQATTPSELLGRTGSVARVAAWGPIPVAAVVAGGVAAAGGTRTAMVVGAVGAITTAFPIVAWRLRGAPD